jgi:hypothetical protein
VKMSRAGRRYPCSGPRWASRSPYLRMRPRPRRPAGCHITNGALVNRQQRRQSLPPPLHQRGMKTLTEHRQYNIKRKANTDFTEGSHRRCLTV